MIPIRLLNGSTIYLNSDLVESVVTAPDTIITLTSGRKIVASSSPDEILDAVVAYRQRCQHEPLARLRGATGSPRPELVEGRPPVDTTPHAHALHA